jgi:hypothetical protein
MCDGTASLRKRYEPILHKAERAIADENKCTLAEVHQIFDQHPIETDKQRFPAP